VGQLTLRDFFFKYESENAKKLVKVIDSAIEIGTKNTLNIEKKLFRGIKNAEMIKDILGKNTLLGLKPGMTFTNRSLSSFSLDEGIALDFAQNKKGVVWVTKTNKGLPIRSISNYPREDEYLLKSESKFRVINKYTKKDITYIEVELIKGNIKTDLTFQY
jgi:hypothetical protein